MSDDTMNCTCTPGTAEGCSAANCVTRATDSEAAAAASPRKGLYGFLVIETGTGAGVHVQPLPIGDEFEREPTFIDVHVAAQEVVRLTGAQLQAKETASELEPLLASIITALQIRQQRKVLPASAFPGSVH